MREIIKKIVFALAPILDIIFLPITFIGAICFRVIRETGIQRFRVSRFIFNTVGVFPIRNHYYEPEFATAYLRDQLSKPRYLPAIDLRTQDQLELVSRFTYGAELNAFPREKPGELRYYYNNPNFVAGDSESLYNVIRYFKPSRIVEIGSGFSTLMAVEARKKNKSENPSYSCEHTCIEPFEIPWLEQLDCKIVRKMVQDIDLSFFSSLQPNDILFIDSSHMIRPSGDVLKEYLEILPLVKPGVIVHIHDIFTPRNYPKEWVVDEVKFWNEQYLLEAFLSFNNRFKVLLAMNYLRHTYPDKIASAFPVMAGEKDSEPGSFWIIAS